MRAKSPEDSNVENGFSMNSELGVDCDRNPRQSPRFLSRLGLPDLNDGST